MHIQEAFDNYGRATKHCKNLVAAHQSLGNGAPGRRYQEVSLDRAIIVLVVAAWQAAVQDLTSAIIDTARPALGTVDRMRYDVIVGHAKKAIGDFSTPNAQNTRNLMKGVGFDPYPYWRWGQSAGRGRPATNWLPHNASDRLDEWLKVRHAIAHGHAEMPTVNALEAVRTDGVTFAPSIRLVDATQAMTFFGRLVSLTSVAAAGHLGVHVDV